MEYKVIEEVLRDEIKKRESFISKQSSHYVQYEDMGHTSTEIHLLKYLIKLFQQVNSGVNTTVQREKIKHGNI